MNRIDEILDLPQYKNVSEPLKALVREAYNLGVSDGINQTTQLIQLINERKTEQ